jgi:hypothetical protein
MNRENPLSIANCTVIHEVRPQAGRPALPVLRGGPLGFSRGNMQHFRSAARGQPRMPAMRQHRRPFARRKTWHLRQRSRPCRCALLSCIVLHRTPDTGLTYGHVAARCSTGKLLRTRRLRLSPPLASWRCLRTRGALAWSAATLARGTRAQDCPSRPVAVVVAYAPGGIGDIFARAVLERISAAPGQTVVADNKPGASGAIIQASSADELAGCVKREAARYSQVVKQIGITAE